MHKSKLAGFIIDCETKDLDAAAKFWSAALGLPTNIQPADVGTAYVPLAYPKPMLLDIEVQQVTHPSRVHLDIETDNLDAEVARLEKLGAKKVEFIKRWWVMESPTGQRFCVVRAKTADFATTSNEWR